MYCPVKLRASTRTVVSVPTVALPPGIPLTVQFRPESTGPVTLAVKYCVCPGNRDSCCGDRTMPMGVVTMTCACADDVGDATEFAVTMKVAGFGTNAGAVYRPDSLMVPKVWFPPATPFTLQVTAVLLVPVMVAPNWAVREVSTVAVEGLTLTAIVGGGASDAEFAELAAADVLPPHDVIEQARPTARKHPTTTPNFWNFIPCRDVQSSCSRWPAQ